MENKSNDEEKNKMPKIDKHDIEKCIEIFESFSNAYLNKKIIWEQEDRKKELMKKSYESQIEDTKNFLKEIKSIGRKPNFYIDPYSTRDSKINNLIQIFNGTLTDEFYSKKRIESKVNEIIEDPESYNQYIKRLEEIREKKNKKKK